MLMFCMPGVAQAAIYNDGSIQARVPGTDVMITDDAILGQQKMYTEYDPVNNRPLFDNPRASITYLLPGQQINLSYSQSNTQWMRFQTNSPYLSLGDADVALDKDGAAKVKQMQRLVSVKDNVVIPAQGATATINLQVWNGFRYDTKATYTVYIFPSTIDMSLYTKVTSKLPDTLNKDYAGGGTFLLQAHLSLPMPQQIWACWPRLAMRIF